MKGKLLHSWVPRRHLDKVLEESHIFDLGPSLFTVWLPPKIQLNWIDYYLNVHVFCWLKLDIFSSSMV